MHILITDSGVGGLSVCAYAERFLRENAVKGRFRLTYVNASPENDFGYNSMRSKSEKIEYFERFLEIINRRYSPDSIYIACNTLSVLYPETSFSELSKVPVRGIVETGVDLLLREIERHPRSIAAIFGTVTTIEEGTYVEALKAAGVDEQRIVTQACPSLADTISEDREGSLAKKKIDKYVNEAIKNTRDLNDTYLAYLACTHYGYRKEYFKTSFGKRDLNVAILNPNDLVVADLFLEFEMGSRRDDGEAEVQVEFVARYRIPEKARRTIPDFLDEISPPTVRAFLDYTYAPDLF
jgi:glutamate racemase